MSPRLGDYNVRALRGGGLARAAPLAGCVEAAGRIAQLASRL